MTSVRKAVLIGLTFGVSLLGPAIGGAGAAEKVPAVQEIVHRANLVSYFQARDGRARVFMEIK
ncbi:MAG: hypothetical protein ACE5JZ_12975, partial [Kiloniellales bacterium]